MVFRNRQKTIRVADVLHGCSPGRIQSVGYMQVIPLVATVMIFAIAYNQVMAILTAFSLSLILTLSTDSLSEIKSTPKALNSSKAITRSRTLLLNRSNLATATAENLSLRASFINRSS